MKDKHYSTPLCEKLYLDNNIWNSEWLNFEIDESLIIDNKELLSLTKIISEKEVDKFHTDY